MTGGTIGAAFLEVARAQPEQTALVCGDERVTYRQLAGWAAAVAAPLADVVEPEELVGVCATRSAGTIATLLGILGADAAYVPMDPRLPDARLELLVREAGIRRLFAAPSDVPRLQALLPAEVMPIAEIETTDGVIPPQLSQFRGGRLAYVMHTSGSTGRPKGVLVEHGSVLALVGEGCPQLSAGEVVLQLAPLHADPSVFEIFGALLNGATLVVPPPDLSVHDIGREVARHGVTVLRLAAPLFRLAVDHVLPDLGGLRLFISGGDRADEDAVRRARHALPGCLVVNGYGPTETTVYACWHVMRGGEGDGDCGTPGSGVPIGRPLAGTSVLVLDDERRLVPPGEPGELCIAGAGVARGYLGQPELTAERFIADPTQPGRRAYLTGDQVRMLPDGNLAFLGRRDDQVKIRGYRVEPAEVEQALLAHDAVRQATVVVEGDHPARRLAAFATLVPGHPATPADLRNHLVALLPSHMVPATVTLLAASDATPTPNAAASPSPATTDTKPPGAAASSPAATATERRLRAIWEDVLGQGVAGGDVSFFDLGGDSLSAMAVLAQVERTWGVAVPLSAVFEAPTLQALADLVDGTEPEPRPPAAPGPGPRRLPLLPGQEGIWFEQQLAPATRYNIARTFVVRGPFDVDGMREALAALAERQAALRVVVDHDGAGLTQSLDGDPAAALRHVDLSALPPAEREVEARKLIAAAATGDGLVRTLVVRLDGSTHLVHFDVHHVIADDWSLDVFFDELSALIAGRELPALDLGYAEHVTGVLERLPHQLAAAREHTRRSLDGWPGSIDLTTDFSRPALLSGRGDTVRVTLDADVATAARRHGVSRFMLYAAAVYAVLSQHAEQDDMCLGALATGRGRAGTDRLIGCFVNVLALRVTAQPDTTVSGLLARVRAACVAAYRHQEVPFQVVSRELGLSGTTGGALPFPVVVNHQQRPPRSLDLPGCAVDPWPAAAPDTALFELGFTFHDTPGGTEVAIEFSTDLYRRAAIETLAGHLVTAVELLTGDGDARLRDLDLAAAEPARPTSRPSPPRREATLHELFARQAAARPDKIAAVGDGGSVTYRELDEVSDRVARRLMREGVRVGDRVAICLDRSPPLIGAILGVLKAGAAYVPLDPSYPADRLSFTVEDAQARVLVATKEIAEALFAPAPAGVRILDVERLAELGNGGKPTPPRTGVEPSDLAYLIYTSGSTGRPRGVMVEHRSVVNTLDGNLALYPLDESDVWLQLTSPGFDVAAYEQFMALVSGGTVVYCGDADRRDRDALTRLLHEHGVTVMTIVPSLLRALGRPDLADVRVLIQAGEPPDVPDTRYFARDRIVLNGYGPTEAAILATTYRVGADDDGARVPMGTALPGTTTHVVDRLGRLAAVGVPGELYLGGAGVGRGYWNNPEQTRRLFGPHPAVGPEPLYRTGDRVRRLPDGNLDYLGRLDDQIKLRGFRIELGEIESALTGCPGVTAAAAVVTGTGPDAEIFAFVVGSAAPAGARDHLQRLLPAPMVPREVVAVPSLPTTSHGKADRKELVRRLPELRAARTAEAAPATTPLEGAVLALWHRLLGPGGIGLDDDFFTVGGHSLRVLDLLGVIERDHGVRLGARSFLEAPTVRATARRVEQLLAGAVPGEELVVERAEVRLDPAITFPAERPSGPGPVLLTGATGFVGAHLLRELLLRSDDEVLCLVRAASAEAGRARLRDVIHRYRLGIDVDDPRLVPIPGDLALPGLGLSAEARRRLAAQGTGAILHAGAQVHHLSGYGWLEAPNVRGTEELLRLAAESRPSCFHHISTLSVFRPGARTITEATSARDERHPRGAGYAASKWAAERLVAEAAARGAPVRVYRLGRAGASSAHGIGDLDDMFSRVLVSSARLGCYPVHPRLRFQVVPVDVMARELVALAGADFPSATAHHLHPSTGPGLAEFMAAHDRRFGTTTPAVELADWVERLAAADGAPLPAAVYREHLRDLSAGTGADGGADVYDNTATQAALAQLGVPPPVLDDAYLERCWGFLTAEEEAPP